MSGGKGPGGICPGVSVRGVYVRGYLSGGYMSGGKGPGGICRGLYVGGKGPGVICPGVSVRGVHVRFFFVLSPYNHMLLIWSRDQIFMRILGAWALVGDNELLVVYRRQCDFFPLDVFWAQIHVLNTQVISHSLDILALSILHFYAWGLNVLCP